MIPQALRRRTGGTAAVEPYALYELSDSFAQLDAAHTGKYQLYEELTGARRLYWRCCHDAIRSRPDWFQRGQYRRTLDLIRNQEQPRSDGAVYRAAEAVSWISQALVTVSATPPVPSSGQNELVDTDDSPHMLAARAARLWNGSQAWSPPERAAFPSSAILTTVHPALRDRTEQLLRTFGGHELDTGSAMAAICLLMLAGAATNPRRVVRIPVVLADLHESPATGVAGVLELSQFSGGPPGLFPDPAGLTIVRTDALFAEGLRVAWEFAHGGSACVVWRLTLDAGGPVAAVDGASLGAAFAVALNALLRRGPAFGPRVLTRTGGFFLRLRSRCAITGAISPPPSRERPGVVSVDRARRAQIDAIGHLEAKIQAAHSKNWRLVAPQANRDDSSPHVPDGMRVDWAGTVRQADRLARRVRPIRTVVAGFAALALIGVSISGALALSYRNSANYQRGVVASARATQESIDLADDSEHTTNYILAAKFAAAAWKVAPTAQARASMLHVLAQPERGTLKATDGGQEANLVAFSPDGKILATGGIDGTLRLWNTVTDRQISSTTIGHTGVSGLAFSPQGHLLAVGGEDGLLRLWNSATHRQIVSPYNIADGANVNELAFSARGSILAIALNNSTAVLWNVATRQQIGLPILGADGAAVDDVAISRDGTILATGGGTGTVRLWNVRTHQQIGGVITASADQNAINGLAFNPAGTIIATNDGGSVQLWDTRTHHRIGRSMTVGPGGGTFNTLTFNAAGTVLATGGGDVMARLWNVANQQQTGASMVASSGSYVSSVAFDPVSNTLATAGDDGTARLWDTGLYREIGSPFVAVRGPYPYVGVALDPTATLLATVSSDEGNDGRLRFWQVAGHRESGSAIPVAGDPSTVAFSPDGATVATGTANGIVSLWNVATRQREGSPIVAVEPGHGHSNWVDDLAFSPNSQTLATLGDDGDVRLWDVSTHRQTDSVTRRSKATDTHRINVVAFSPDGRILAMGLGDGTAALWNTADHRWIGRPMPASDGTDELPSVNDLTFSPDGRTLATAGQDGTARIYSVSTQRQIGPSMAVGTVAGFVAFTAKGAILATEDNQGAVQLWDVATATQIASFTVPQSDFSLAYAARAGLLATGGYDGTARLWDISLPSNVFGQVCAIAGGPLSRAQWASSVGSAAYRSVC